MMAVLGHQIRQLSLASLPPEIREQIRRAFIAGGGVIPNLSVAPMPSTKPVHRPPIRPFKLTSLPREIRDRVYYELVVSSDTIAMHYTTLDPPGVYMRFGHMDGVAPSLLFLKAVAGTKIASEVYEEFFRHNVFHLEARMVPMFLHDAPAILRDFTEPLRRRTSLSKETLEFDKQAWLRNFEITYYCVSPEVKGAENLALVLQCPRIKTVRILFSERTIGARHNYLVEEKIGLLATVITGIRKKIAGGLTVQAEKTWFTYDPSASDPALEDITWMWDEPNEQVKKEVETGVASHRDHIKVQFSGAWKAQGRPYGAWTTHWYQDHIIRMRTMSEDSEN